MALVVRWMLRRFAPRNDGKHSFAISPHISREFCYERPALRNQRAQGMPGARRARSLACKVKKHTSVVTTVTPVSPGIPYAMVLTVSFVLSPVTGLVCHRRRRSFLRQLDTSVGASGPHDFAVRLTRHSSKAPSASTASRATFVTIAKRPSGERDGESYSLICISEKQKSFLQKGLDKRKPAGQLICPSGSRHSSR